MLENSIDKSPLTMRNSMLNKALFPVHIYEKLISVKPSMIQLSSVMLISDMTNMYLVSWSISSHLRLCSDFLGLFCTIIPDWCYFTWTVLEAVGHTASSTVQVQEVPE